MSIENDRQLPDKPLGEALRNGSSAAGVPLVQAAEADATPVTTVATETEQSEHEASREPLSPSPAPAEAPMAANTFPAGIPWLGWLETLQKVGLAVTSLVYILGYAVWAYHAWRYNLGALPALQSQYLTAGLMPALILWLAFHSTRLIKACVEAIGAVFLPGAAPWMRRMRPLVIGTYIVFCIVFILLLVADVFRTLPVTLIYILYLSFFGVGLGLPILLRMRDKLLSKIMRFDANDWLYVAVLPAWTVFILICVDVRYVFPNTPQEWGGALPRIAQLVVDRSSLSDDRLRALIPSHDRHSGSRVIETVPVYVFFSSAQSMIVKPYARWTDNRAYEIEANTIRGVTWLDRDRRPTQAPVTATANKRKPVPVQSPAPVSVK